MWAKKEKLVTMVNDGDWHGFEQGLSRCPRNRTENFLQPLSEPAWGTLDARKIDLRCVVSLRWMDGDMCCLYPGSSYIGVPADSPQVNWRICSHKDVSPIICKAVVNDSSCEAGMHHFQADLSLTSHSRVLLIQIYIWQDTLWAYIKWIRTPLGHSESTAK